MKKDYKELSVYPKHIAFIMDGNGRWAKKRMMPRSYGHKYGCEALIKVLKACRDFGVNYVSLYAFSTENWKRSEEEVNYLMTLIDEYFTKYLNRLQESNVKVIVSGFEENLPINVKNVITKITNETKNNTGQVLNLCFNYGSKQELVMATKAIANEVKNGKLRSSGEQRISNFLLYQIAYAELYFTKVHWPDFDKDVVYECLKEFESRQRRFGGV